MKQRWHAWSPPPSGTAGSRSLYQLQKLEAHAADSGFQAMHIIYDYLALVEDGRIPVVPKTYVFAGKAAPGYWLAKQIIKLIHNVGRVINTDARAPRGSRWPDLPYLYGGEEHPGGANIEILEEGGQEDSFRDRDPWTRMTILNVARMGKFSSDRTVAEYAYDIWNRKGV